MPKITVPTTWKYTPVRPHPAKINAIDTSPQFRYLNTPSVDMRPAIQRLNIQVKQQPRGNCAVHAFIFLHE